ncbi:hypothetical protein ACOCG7_34055 (plasmid) [Paraburkholderia sp. DD10]|uniref:hypothetical protein n=1 Tax=Paraburkholderia sp. DD10 TaxID=3409691 RepID=UPI003B9F933C
MAQARRAAKQAALKGQKVVAPQADGTTDALLSLLPWAGTVDTVPVNLDKLAALASTLISSAADRVQTMNTLLPPDAKLDQQSETAPSGLNKSLMSFTLAGQSQTLRNINTLAAFRAFHLLALLSAAHLHTMLTMQPPATDGQLDTETRIFNVARFLSAYFDAYFRGGQFLQVTFNQQEFLSTLATRVQHQLPARGKTSSSTQDIIKVIKPAFDSADKNDFVTRLANSFPAQLSSGDVGSLSNDQIKDFLQPVFDKVCAEQGASDASCAISTLGKSAFVTRAGLSVQFSGVSFEIGGKDSIGITHTYPQLALFGPQLVRVFVEALFDANGQHLPGVPNSTACDPTNHLFGAGECMKPGDAANERALRIDMLSASAEAISATGTGVILRGIGPAGLNNELVASMLETLVGV